MGGARAPRLTLLWPATLYEVVPKVSCALSLLIRPLSQSMVTRALLPVVAVLVIVAVRFANSCVVSQGLVRVLAMLTLKVPLHALAKVCRQVARLRYAPFVVSALKLCAQSTLFMLPAPVPLALTRAPPSAIWLHWNCEEVGVLVVSVERMPFSLSWVGVEARRT